MNRTDINDDQEAQSETTVVWSGPSDPVRLTPGELHLWRLALDVSPQLQAQLDRILSPAERARAGRFAHEVDRQHFAVARGALRVLLATYQSTEPEACQIELGKNGKPFLIENGKAAPLRFNLSHSHGCALFGFTLGHEIGVDIERVQLHSDAEQLAKRYFSAAEYREIAELDGDRRIEGFLNCWTRKEAYVKARGNGMAIDLGSFSVSCRPGAPPELRSADSANWAIRSFRPYSSDYVAAVVVERNDWKWKFYDASNLIDNNARR